MFATEKKIKFDSFRIDTFNGQRSALDQLVLYNNYII